MLDQNSSASELDTQIHDLTKQIEQLSSQEKSYAEQVQKHHNQATTLKNRLADLDLTIRRTASRIEKTKVQIDRTRLEIESLTLRIRQKDVQRGELRTNLTDLIGQLAMIHETSPMIVLLRANNITDAVGELDALENTQSELHERIIHVQSLSDQLSMERGDVEKKQKELDALIEDLSGTRGKLVNEKTNKVDLLDATRNSEEKYQALLQDIRNELNTVNSEVLRLDKILRNKLSREGKIQALGKAILSWPVPGRTITTYFHAPDYPFRKIFEHNAIDIRAPYRTSVVAAAPGYVGKVRDGGKKGYSYIMLIHGEDMTTVYGHLSSLLVQEGSYVARGDQIGLSGGLPGTPGAGPFSTGAHLHFEVHKNGVAIDPLQLLP